MLLTVKQSTSGFWEMQEWEGQLQPSVHAVACRMVNDSEQWEEENRMSEQKNKKV